MDLDFAMLADGVTPRPDGKLDIYGAGWDTIWARAAPATHARMVLAVRLLLSRSETDHPHRLEVVVRGADGGEIARALGPLDPLPEDDRHQIPEGGKAGLGMVLNFENLTFPEFGDYQVLILWDGNEVRPPLRLTVAAAAAQ